MDYRPYHQKGGTKFPPSFEKQGKKFRRVRTSPGSVSEVPDLQSFMLKSSETALEPSRFLKPRKESRELGSGHYSFSNSRPRAVSWTEESTTNTPHVVFKSHRRPTSSPPFHNISRLRMKSSSSSNPFAGDGIVHSPTYFIDDATCVWQPLEVPVLNHLPMPQTPHATLERVPSAPPPCLPRTDSEDGASDNVTPNVLLPDF